MSNPKCPKCNYDIPCDEHAGRYAGVTYGTSTREKIRMAALVGSSVTLSDREVLALHNLLEEVRLLGLDFSLGEAYRRFCRSYG